METLLVVGFIVAALTAAILAYVHDRKRRRLLRAWARSQGFTLHEESRRGWERDLPAFKLLGRGRSRHTALHVEGEVDGRRIRCLDYRFTTGSGKNRKTHRYGMVVLDAGTPLIPLRIRREHVFDQVGEFFGHGDIDFESSEFSRRFHVSSSDRRWAYDVIHTGTMEYLLGIDAPTIEFGFAEIAVYRSGALAASRCHADLKVARKMLELVPEDVLAQLRGGR
ncbi:MAG: hypothetical protein R6X25_07065 [Candidatus Krumholzibacteriia bacterium]